MLIDRLVVEDGYSECRWVSNADLALEFPKCDVASFDEDEFFAYACQYIDYRVNGVLSTDYASIDYCVTDE